MLNSRQFTVISVVTASLIYSWYRFHRKKKQALKEKKKSEKNISVEKSDQSPQLILDKQNCAEEIFKKNTDNIISKESAEEQVSSLTKTSTIKFQPPTEQVIAPVESILVDTQATLENIITPIQGIVPIETSIFEFPPIDIFLSQIQQTAVETQHSPKKVDYLIESVVVESKPIVEKIAHIKTSVVELEPSIPDSVSIQKSSIEEFITIIEAEVVASQPLIEENTPIEISTVELQSQIEEVIIPISEKTVRSQPSTKKDIASRKTKTVNIDPPVKQVITSTETNTFITRPTTEEVITPKPIPVEKENNTLVDRKLHKTTDPASIESNMLKKVTDNAAKGINTSAAVAVPQNNECDMSGSEISDEVATPSSSQADSDEKAYDFPKGIFNDPENDIIEDSSEIINGRRIPRVLVPSDLWAEAVEKDTWRETFYVPASMGGVLIGRFGKNVRELKSQWNAEFSLNMCPGRQDTLLLRLSCPSEHKENVLHWITSRFKMRPSQTTIGNPNQLRRVLPLGEYTNVKVRSLYGLKEFFVTIKDGEYERYEAMQKELDKDYSTLNSTRMQLYEPVTSGTVAVSSHVFGFARALILKVILTWPRQAVCFLLDHGTFGVVSLSELKKIKAKYMRVPFQAIHVSWAHALPIYCDVPDLHILRTFFTSDRTFAYPVRMETCCRSSIALLDCIPPQKNLQQPTYTDILALACRSGLYVVSPLGVFPNRQMWVNRTNKPYYPCPNSEIDYTQLVEYYNDESYPDQQNQQLQPLGTSQSQNIMQGHRRQNNNGKGRGGFNRGTARRFRGGSQGANRAASNEQRRTSESQKSAQNENSSKPTRQNTSQPAKRANNNQQKTVPATTT